MWFLLVPEWAHTNCFVGVASLALWLGVQFAVGRLFFQPAVNEHKKLPSELNLEL